MPESDVQPNAFEPYAPLNTPKPFAEDVFIIDRPEIRMDDFGLKLPFATRMTVVRLPDGGLWIHSPVAPNATLLGRLADLGVVRWLVALNSLHYWWLPDWAAQFPAKPLWPSPSASRGGGDDAGMAPTKDRPLPRALLCDGRRGAAAARVPLGALTPRDGAPDAC